jgi:hypothetical protein
MASQVCGWCMFEKRRNKPITWDKLNDKRGISFTIMCNGNLKDSPDKLSSTGHPLLRTLIRNSTPSTYSGILSLRTPGCWTHNGIHTWCCNHMYPACIHVSSTNSFTWLWLMWLKLKVHGHRVSWITKYPFIQNSRRPIRIKRWKHNTQGCTLFIHMQCHAYKCVSGRCCSELVQYLMHKQVCLNMCCNVYVCIPMCRHICMHTRTLFLKSQNTETRLTMAYLHKKLQQAMIRW